MAAPSTLLSVSPSIPEAFASISNSASTSRCLYLRIVGEDITLLKDGGSAEGEVGEEFGKVGEELSNDQAAFVLFNLSCSSPSSPLPKWLLVSWVPDLSKVRDKMLYSSSVTHLKKTLGLTSFTSEGGGDYHASEKEDVRWDVYVGSLVKVLAFNEREAALNQEKVRRRLREKRKRREKSRVVLFVGFADHVLLFSSSSSSSLSPLLFFLS